MVKQLNWAILGTGKIARRFGSALNNLPGANFLAVGSRSQETCVAYADEFGVERRIVGYENVAADPDIDIVYVGTPGIFHHRDVTMCLEAGKHVLCEKAMTINAAETSGLINLAREKNLFLMEAMWTRFVPTHVKIRELLPQGIIGKPLGMLVNSLAAPPFDPANRFFDLNLGGGILLDMNSYGISWAHSLWGVPECVTGLAHFGETGTDDTAAIVLRFAGGQLASIVASQEAYDVKDAVIYGTAGRIDVHPPWYKGSGMTIHRLGHEPETIIMPFEDGYNGYEYEALEVMNCIHKGKIESEIMPHNESLAIMQTMDKLRAQWGLKYPTE
ncbi:MAG: Gfo/Idh/MocA family oxidoreductase [Candidatus Promineifilaceae bacterium]|nr:Gfo/Idh/MocA family oxidoreductase [Candidatus Promineifilaceae bacterium]